MPQPAPKAILGEYLKVYRQEAGAQYSGQRTTARSYNKSDGQTGSQTAGSNVPILLKGSRADRRIGSSAGRDTIRFCTRSLSSDALSVYKFTVRSVLIARNLQYDYS